MILSLIETKRLFDLVIGSEPDGARTLLHSELQASGHIEPEFYKSVIEYHARLNYNSEQWFDFLSKIPNRIFRHEIGIMNKLSGKQMECLPPATFEAI